MECYWFDPLHCNWCHKKNQIVDPGHCYCSHYECGMNSIALRRHYCCDLNSTDIIILADGEAIDWFNLSGQFQFLPHKKNPKFIENSPPQARVKKNLLDYFQQVKEIC
jgi:hypothetical protein